MLKLLLVIAISGFYIESSNAGCCSSRDVDFVSFTRETVTINGKVVRDECNTCQSGPRSNFYNTYFTNIFATLHIEYTQFN